jgi:hypothetical protein
MDEADRLLKTPFHDSLFGLLRYWHNSRAMNDTWDRFDIVMAISTEPHLLIKDQYQSPFNVGSRILLEDFNETQVRELNRRYRSPVDDNEIPALVELLNGHPYLTARALYTMLSDGMTWNELAQIAVTEKSPFGDHLRRYLWMLRDQPQLKAALNQIIRQGKCSDENAYDRLLQAGLIKKTGNQSCKCRCKLYEEYLKDKLR